MCESVEVTPTHLKAQCSTWKMVFGVLGERPAYSRFVEGDKQDHMYEGQSVLSPVKDFGGGGQKRH